DISHAAFYKPADDSREMHYLHAKCKELGGSLPARHVKCSPLKAPGDDFVQVYRKGSGEKTPSTTMVFVDMLGRLLRDREGIGKWIVPIIPDEARTFGMDPLFATYKIY